MTSRFLPRFGLGGGPVGDLPDDTEDQALTTIEAAYHAGIRYFDTAPRHGLGRSERRLGTTLRRHPRAAYLVSTRAGEIVTDEGLRIDLSQSGIARALDESLARLGLETIDLLVTEHAEALPTLKEFRAEGVVRAIGLVVDGPGPIEDHPDVVLLPHGYTLLDQSAEPLLQECAARAIEVVIYGVFTDLLSAESAPEVVTRLRRITAICERYGVSLPQAALAFPARHPAVACTLVAAGSAAEIRAGAALVRRPIPVALWADLAEAQ